jgi:peptide/nickel transport system substrate-binding protein/oligopeptide transport system substrate-binding protein
MVTLAALALAACGPRIDNDRLRVDIVESQPRPVAAGRLPLSPASSYLRKATAQGLVGFDLEGAVVPALAERWITTEDGLSYIFRLRKLRWNDNRELTSDEVASALSATIREQSRGRLSDELAMIERVVPMTGKVVEIRLKAPMPNLLELLAQPEFGLLRKGVGSGPMLARKQGTGLQLSRRIDDPAAKVSTEDAMVVLAAHDAPTALARYVNGNTDLLLQGRFEDIPYLAATEGGDAATFDPALGLFGLRIEGTGPFLSDAANREAITKAIDRPRLIADFDVDAWREMLTLSPEVLQNRALVARPEWTARRIDIRKAEARSVIQSWQAANGKVRPLRIALPRGPGSRIMFARIHSDLAAIGLSAERVTMDKEADLRLIDEVADFSSPAWYLEQLSCRATPLCSEEADILVADALVSTDRAERMRLLGEAEQNLQSLRNFIPIAYPLRWSLPRDGLLGFAPNPRGWHPLQYLGRDPT